MDLYAEKSFEGSRKHLAWDWRYDTQPKHATVKYKPKYNEHDVQSVKCHCSG